MQMLVLALLALLTRQNLKNQDLHHCCSALLLLLTLQALLGQLTLLTLLTQLLLKSVARCCVQPAVDKSV